MDDGEEAVARDIDVAKDGDIDGKIIIGDEGFSNVGVGDGDDDALVEGFEEEVLLVWVPRQRFRVEVG